MWSPKNQLGKRGLRFLLMAVLAIGLSMQTGCSWLVNAFYRGQSPPQLFTQTATKEQIITAVNQNSQAIQSMQAKVHVRATGTPTLSGDLSVEQPSRLRMQVGLLGMTNSGLDIGSNDNEFWVWIKSAMPGGPAPAVLHATHQEYAQSQIKQALPIEPSWVIDSLGLAYFDPRVNHQGPFTRPDGSLEIRSSYQSSTGPMMKSTMVDPNQGVVIAQELYRNGVKVASSRASKHQYFPEINASIPRLIEIEIGGNTPQPGSVTIELHGIMPNSIDATYAGIWEMPRPQNIEMINIATQNPQSIPTQAFPNQGIPNQQGQTNSLQMQGGAGQTNSFGSPGGVSGVPRQFSPTGTPQPFPNSGAMIPNSTPNPGANFYPSSAMNPNARSPQTPARPATYQDSGINQDYLPRGFNRQ